MKRRMKRHAVVQPLDQSYRLIPLTQDQNAIVDAADYEWLSQWNWCAAWSPMTKSFYAIRSSYNNGQKRTVFMHRELFGCGRGEEVDHQDHTTLNNRRYNLRKCTRSQNQANKTMQEGEKSSVYRGSTWHKRDQKWTAQVRCNGKLRFLGYFASEEAAARAYDTAATELFGEFAHLNFPCPTA